MYDYCQDQPDNNNKMDDIEFYPPPTYVEIYPPPPPKKSSIITEKTRFVKEFSIFLAPFFFRGFRRP